MRDAVFLLFGFILLWIPRGLLRMGRPEGSGRSKGPKKMPAMRKDRQPGDHSLWAGEEFARTRNWVDLARAYAGAMALISVVPGLAESWVGRAGEEADVLAFGILAGVLAASLLIQMLRVEERLTLFPPVFFVTGLAFALVGWKAALLAFIGVWAINIVLPNPGVFMTAFGGSVLLLAIFFGTETRSALLAMGLAVFPPLMAVLLRRRLAQFRKRTKVLVR